MDLVGGGGGSSGSGFEENGAGARLLRGGRGGGVGKGAEESEAGTAAMAARRRAGGGVPPGRSGTRGRRAGPWPGWVLGRPSSAEGFFFTNRIRNNKNKRK